MRLRFQEYDTTWWDKKVSYRYFGGTSLFFASRSRMELGLADSNRTLAFISKLQDFTTKKMVIFIQGCFFFIGLYRKTSFLIAKKSLIRQTNYYHY